MTDRICVGAFAGSYGVKGEVRLKSFCADPQSIADFELLFNEMGDRSYTLDIVGPIKNGLAVRVQGISNKEQADELRGVSLYVDRAAFPSIPDDEYYHADLIGVHVFDTGGTLLGTVKSVVNHGAGDLLEVKALGLTETILLPFTLASVPTVDISSGRIVADPPEGLFPE